MGREFTAVTVAEPSAQVRTMPAASSSRPIGVRSKYGYGGAEANSLQYGSMKRDWM